MSYTSRTVEAEIVCQLKLNRLHAESFLFYKIDLLYMETVNTYIHSKPCKLKFIIIKLK